MCLNLQITAPLLLCRSCCLSFRNTSTQTREEKSNASPECAMLAHPETGTRRLLNLMIIAFAIRYSVR